ncbi:MAG TPA: flagellar assembly protein FliW [Firmicutes bacterium]|nr:flagellar assembly protein FliW [Bacillota bacterium]
MKVKTKFYGEVEVAAEEIIHFPDGLPGFETEKEFVYLREEDAVFGCLQSCHHPETAFIVLSPFKVCPDYDFELDEEKREALAIEKLEEVLVLTIVTIPPGKPEEAMVNLYAPVVINTTVKKGMQVILSESGYPLRFNLWKKESATSVAAAK